MELESIAGKLRRAATRSDFAGAQSAARLYVRAVGASLAGLAPDDRKARLSEAMRLSKRESGM
jgi:hypothetical protein